MAMTQDEVLELVELNREAAHVGWLLACDAPVNKAKGKRLYDALSRADQTVAEAYRDHCIAIYEGGRNG